MTQETEAGRDEAATPEAGRSWRPSRAPEHRSRGPESARRIVERSPGDGGLMALLRGWFATPLVKIIVGVSLFITGALIYDATINGGAWTERPPKPKPAQHAPIHRPPLRDE